MSSSGPAAAIVADASGVGVLTALPLIDVVDVVAASALGSVGLDHIEIRRVAGTLWGN